MNILTALGKMLFGPKKKGQPRVHYKKSKHDKLREWRKNKKGR